MLEKQQSDYSNYMEAVGQSDEEKASKWVIESQNQAEKLEAEAKIKLIEDAQKQTRWKKKDYVHTLAKQLFIFMEQVEMPSGGQWRVSFEEDRLALWLKVGSKLFAKGIKPVGTAIYDIQALETLVLEAENTIERVNPKSGIYLPNGKVV